MKVQVQNKMLFLGSSFPWINTLTEMIDSSFLEYFPYHKQQLKTLTSSLYSLLYDAPFPF